MSFYTINSQAYPLSRVMPFASIDEIKNEPMLFNCDMAHAYQRGGSITRAFLDRLPLEWHDCPVVVDTRVHMLMPGWYPCIPGWHHDDVPRTRSDRQPNYDFGQNRSWHIVGLVNGRICPTQYAEGNIQVPKIEDGSIVYSRWHDLVEQRIKEGVLNTWHPEEDQLVMFNDMTWHRGTPAKEKGWRWFGRVSRYFDVNGRAIPRGNPRTNEIRRQVQVYLPTLNQGW